MNNTNREPYQKIIPCILAVMAMIFAVWTGINRTHEGVSFYETLLEISRQGSTTVYSGTLYGDAVTITCREEAGTSLVTFSAPGHYSAACRVESPEGTIDTQYGESADRIRIIRNDEVLFSGGYAPSSNGKHFYNEDGSWEPFTTVSVTGSGDPWHYFAFGIHDILRFAEGPATSARGSWVWFFVMAIGSLIAALETVFRDEIFYLSHFLHVRDPEPTEFYCICHKYGSVIAVILLFVFYIKGVFTIV